ncbi:hypothetical protein T03_16197, partial [Trichinella britovi]
MDPCARGRPPVSWYASYLIWLRPTETTNRCADWGQAVNAPHWLMLTIRLFFDQRRHQKIPPAECRQKIYRNCGCNLASIGQPHPLSHKVIPHRVRGLRLQPYLLQLAELSERCSSHV